MEYFVRIFEEDGEHLADLIPADDQEGRKWLRGKVKGFSYWLFSSAKPKYMVHVYFQGDSPPDSVREHWNARIAAHVMELLDDE